MGETMLPRKIPILNHILFNGLNKIGFVSVIIKNITLITKDHILISFPFNSGQKEIIKKNTQKTKPKLLSEPILILFLFFLNLLN